LYFPSITDQKIFRLYQSIGHVQLPDDVNARCPDGLKGGSDTGRIVNRYPIKTPAVDRKDLNRCYGFTGPAGPDTVRRNTTSNSGGIYNRRNCRQWWGVEPEFDIEKVPFIITVEFSVIFGIFNE
jgi:hypothetical protein